MTRRILQLLLGLVLYGVAIALMVRAAIGVAPWDVLTQGISRQTGWGFGLLTVLVGAAVLLAWIPLRERPGVGTVLNVLIVGPAAGFGLWLIPDATGIWLRISLFAVGLALLAIATGLYIGARFGSGPRDGLMTGIHRRTGWPLWVGRTLVEIAVLGAGWAMGGNVGPGTVLFAALVGPLCNLTIPWFDQQTRVRRRQPGASEPIVPVAIPAQDS